VDRKSALLVAICTATIAFALAFAYPVFEETRVAWYYPLEHRWGFEVRPTALAMDFFGRLAMATIVALLAAAPSYAIALRLRLGRPALQLLVAWATTVTLLVMAYYGWTLYNRNPVPEPLPSWYQPR
jgi:hypothetical protein